MARIDQFIYDRVVQALARDRYNPVINLCPKPRKHYVLKADHVHLQLPELFR